MSRLRDEFAGALTHPGALALGVAVLIAVGSVLRGAFDDPRVYHVFHDAERARATVTDIQKVRAFPARWLATVNWTSASQAKGSAQVRVGPRKWWMTSAPEIDVGANTDILLSRSVPGEAIWLKNPPSVVPWKMLGIEFNPEALLMAALIAFAGFAGMLGISAMSRGAGGSSDDSEAADAVVGGTVGKALDWLMNGFLVLLVGLIIVGAISYAAGFNILEWLGVAP